MTKPRKPKPPPVNELWGIKKVGEELGLNRDQARSLLTMVPVAEKDGLANLYAKDAVLAAAKNRTKKNEASEGSREWYEIEKLKRQIDKLDFEMDVQRGKYIPRDEVFQSFLAMALQFRSHLNDYAEKMPPTLAGCAPQEMQARIAEANEEILAKLRVHKWQPSGASI